MQLNKGDTVTFLEDGKVTVKVEGAKAYKQEVAAGEVVTMTQSADVDGVLMYVERAPVGRVTLKRKQRHQTVRTCDLSMATLEAPPPPDAEARRIEAILAERGAQMRARLAHEAERLKRG